MSDLNHASRIHNDTLTNKGPIQQHSSYLTPRHNWDLAELLALYTLPFPDLLFLAQTVHRSHFSPTTVQRSTLLSIKTGGCSENCAYCPQSAHYDTGLKREKLLSKDIVVSKAKEAKDQGATRFCMGAAWREVKNNAEFDQIIELVESVHALGMEVCCTLGMLSEEQAERLKAAGCYAYNHNLDTAPEFYGNIISTRTYQDRLNTLKAVRKAGMTVCCGGIIGMGETLEHRMGLLQQLTIQDPHPESVPINLLVRVAGTPLSENDEVDPFDFVRMVATTRIALPKSMVRLSAGRNDMHEATQALCFLAGANSIFSGEKLLTTPNPQVDADENLLSRLGMSFSR
jgi:biotin synthase